MEAKAIGWLVDGWWSKRFCWFFSVGFAATECSGVTNTSATLPSSTSRVKTSTTRKSIERGGGVDRRGGPKGEQQPRSSAKLLQLRPPLLTFDCWQSLRVLNNAIWNWLKDEIKSRGSYRIPAENLAERKERSTDRNRDLHHTQSNRIAGIQTNKEFRRIFR